MDQKKINSLIIGVIGLLLITTGFYYYKTKEKSVLVEEEKVVSGDTTDVFVDPLTKAEEDKKKADLANTEELKAQEVAKRAKWNTAMNNARIAFGKGEYDNAISFYNEALSYYKTDTAYSGLFFTYSALNNVDKARLAIDDAIKLNPLFVEHWIAKLVFLDGKTEVSFADLKRIYEEALSKIDQSTKTNLVTVFAGIAEKNWQKTEAMALWEYAKELYPENSAIYQAEIDRLKKN